MSRLPFLAGQLLWVGFEGREVPPSLTTRIRAGHVGHVILFSRNLGTLPEISAMCDQLHAAAPAETPLLVAVDQEGGRVQRVRAPATVWPPMNRLGMLAERDEAAALDMARRVGRALGDELSALGFDVDFAPVLDVHTNPANPVIGDRALAESPERVWVLARELAAGLADAGVLPCGKHFPGHGDTHLDSHLALPRIDHDMSRLRQIELVPFELNLHLPMFMTAHVVFAALDPDVPATLSPRVITGLLRQELGYEGVIVSDDMEMKAVADHWSAEEGVERALMAGCDLFLLCREEALQLRVHEHLVKLAETRSDVRARIEESAERVRRMKSRAHGHRPRPAMDVIGSAAHQELARRLASEA